MHVILETSEVTIVFNRPKPQPDEVSSPKKKAFERLEEIDHADLRKTTNFKHQKSFKDELRQLDDFYKPCFFVIDGKIVELPPGCDEIKI